MMIRAHKENRVTITGNLTRDPKVSDGKNGRKGLFFTVAHNDRYLDQKDNTWKDRAPVYASVSLWHKAERVDALQKRLKEGMLVYVEGQLRSQVQKPEGNTVNITTLTIEARTLDILSYEPKAGTAATGKPEEAPEHVEAEPVAEGEEIPF